VDIGGTFVKFRLYRFIGKRFEPVGTPFRMVTFDRRPNERAATAPPVRDGHIVGTSGTIELFGFKRMIKEALDINLGGSS
jgi:hypothetical protein